MKFQKKPEDNSEWPTELLISKDQENYEENAYYSWVIQPNQSKAFWQILALFALLVLVLSFPFWPKGSREIFAYGFSYITGGVILLIALKFVLFFVLRVFGIEFVIFPNLLEEVSFLQSFFPIVSVSKSKGHTGMLIYRFIGAIVLGLLIGHIITEKISIVQKTKEFWTLYVELLESFAVNVIGRSSSSD